MEIAKGFLWVEADSEDGFSEDDLITTSILKKLYNVTVWLWFFLYQKEKNIHFTM